MDPSSRHVTREGAGPWPGPGRARDGTKVQWRFRPGRFKIVGGLTNSMDKQLVGVSFEISEAGPTTWTLRTNISHYRYGGITEADHTCKRPRPLMIGDSVRIQRVAEPSKDLIVLGPCGCKHLLYALRA